MSFFAILKPLGILGLFVGFSVGCGSSTNPSRLSEAAPVPGNQADVATFTKAFNEYRAKNGRTALSFNQQLTNNAAENNRLQNQRGIGHFFMGRGTLRQNSAWNHASTSAVLSGWHNSAGHRENMLAPNVNCYGIHWLGKYWTMDLGRCDGPSFDGDDGITN